jgi:hypothetical protein
VDCFCNSVVGAHFAPSNSFGFLRYPLFYRFMQAVFNCPAELREAGIGWRSTGRRQLLAHIR